MSCLEGGPSVNYGAFLIAAVRAVNGGAPRVPTYAFTVLQGRRYGISALQP